MPPIYPYTQISHSKLLQDGVHPCEDFHNHSIGAFDTPSKQQNQISQKSTPILLPQKGCSSMHQPGQHLQQQVNHLQHMPQVNLYQEQSQLQNHHQHHQHSLNYLILNPSSVSCINQPHQFARKQSDDQSNKLNLGSGGRGAIDAYNGSGCSSNYLANNTKAHLNPKNNGFDFKSLLGPSANNINNNNSTSQIETQINQRRNSVNQQARQFRSNEGYSNQQVQQSQQQQIVVQNTNYQKTQQNLTGTNQIQTNLQSQPQNSNTQGKNSQLQKRTSQQQLHQQVQQSSMLQQQLEEIGQRMGQNNNRGANAYGVGGVPQNYQIQELQNSNNNFATTNYANSSLAVNQQFAEINATERFAGQQFQSQIAETNEPVVENQQQIGSRKTRPLPPPIVVKDFPDEDGVVSDKFNSQK